MTAAETHPAPFVFPARRSYLRISKLVAWLGPIFVLASFIVFFLYRGLTGQAAPEPQLAMGLIVYGFVAMVLVIVVASILAVFKDPLAEKDLYSLDDWLTERYGLTLTFRQLRRLATGHPNVANNRFVSKPIRVLSDARGSNGDRYYPYINYVLTDFTGVWMLYIPEFEMEARLLEDMRDSEFFGTFWQEVAGNDDRVYTYFADSQPEMGELEDGTAVVLFWSDPTRAQLYAPERADDIAYATIRSWRREQLPYMNAQQLLVGLNWGEERRAFKPEEILELLHN